MDLIDYYELLDIPRESDVDTIKKAVRNQRKDWTRKQNHPNPDVRARAEKRIQGISEAEQALLDASRRADYDRRLAAHVEQPPQQSGATPGRNWVGIAQEYLDAGNATQAHMAGTEATNQNQSNPEGWYVRAQASLELENLANAQFEISEALRLSPNHAEYHSVLGDIFVDADQFDTARKSYEHAQSLEPSNPYYALGIADTYMRSGKPDLALPLVERALERDPGNQGLKNALASVIMGAASNKWSTHADDSMTITNDAQLECGKKALVRIETLGITDNETLASIDEFRRVVTDAGTVRWYSSDSLIGYGGALAVAVIIMFVAGGGLSFLAFAAVVAIIALYVYRHRMVDWKWRGRKLPNSVTRTGIQTSVSV